MALEKAAQNGKQVTVLMEVKARFDEANNIQMARRLEKAGAHVIYGLVGLKTHSKCTLIIRREADGIRRYVHVATGNYNASTAKIIHGFWAYLRAMTSSAAMPQLFLTFCPVIQIRRYGIHLLWRL